MITVLFLGSSDSVHDSGIRLGPASQQRPLGKLDLRPKAVSGQWDRSWDILLNDIRYKIKKI
jgi:hypothetical protein